MMYMAIYVIVGRRAELIVFNAFVFGQEESARIKANNVNGCRTIPKNLLAKLPRASTRHKYNLFGLLSFIFVMAF